MKLFNVKRLGISFLLVSNVHYFVLVSNVHYDISRRKGRNSETEKEHYGALCRHFVC